MQDPPAKNAAAQEDAPGRALTTDQPLAADASVRQVRRLRKKPAPLELPAPSDDGPCPVCGSPNGGWRTCGLRMKIGVCGRRDPRLLSEPVSDVHDPVVRRLATMAADDPMRAAMEGQLLVRRCGARCRTTGQPCRSLAVRGGLRCRMHGGRSTGPKPKTGRYSLEAQCNRRLATLCLRIVRETQPKLEPVEVDAVGTTERFPSRHG